MPIMNLLQELYDSEINFSISIFFDEGFSVKLGDDINGWIENELCKDTNEVFAFLVASVVKHYPKSVMAKRILHDATKD